jgi:ubiquinone/menaquinone biosynthesis C-methylase UbiE
MDELTSKTQMAKIRGFEKGFMAAHLINLGAKVGVFEALHERSEGMDWEKPGKFKLQPHLGEILGDRSHFKNYLANIALSVDLVGKMFDEFPQYYRSSQVMEDVYTPEASKAVAQTTKNMHLAFAFMILPKNEELRHKLEHGVKVLEIGCGRGALIIQLAKAFGNSTFVGVDPDSYGIEDARSKIAKMGLGDRVSVENIGGQDLRYEEEFDMVLMVVTLHEIHPGIRQKVVEKAFQALRPGGQIVILDFPFPSTIEDFRNPLYDMAILEQFFEICFGFVHLNNEERNEMLMQVGFRDLKHMPIGKGMFELVTAIK